MIEMKNKIFLSMTTLAVALSTGFTSCSSDDDADTTTVTGSQAAVNQACDDWKTARANWENTEAFLFGAAASPAGYPQAGEPEFLGLKTGENTTNRLTLIRIADKII